MFVSVDLPIPGAPPSSTSEPGTSPPPSTRSSSPTPVDRRSTGAAPTSASGREVLARGLPPRVRLAAAPARPARPLPAPELAGARSSTSVFHSPQPGHCPCHWADCNPHSEQTWIDDWARDIRARSLRCAGDVVPLRECATRRPSPRRARGRRRPRRRPRSRATPPRRPARRWCRRRRHRRESSASWA